MNSVIPNAQPIHIASGATIEKAQSRPAWGMIIDYRVHAEPRQRGTGNGAAWARWATNKSCSVATPWLLHPPSRRSANWRIYLRIADLSEKFPDAEAYNADETNNGLDKVMTYTSQDNPKNKLTLTEKSSKEISHKHHLVCGRDEDNSIEPQDLSHRAPECVPASDVTLQCQDYLLTTKGGRPCISN